MKKLIVPLILAAVLMMSACSGDNDPSATLASNGTQSIQSTQKPSEKPLSDQEEKAELIKKSDKSVIEDSWSVLSEYDFELDGKEAKVTLASEAQRDSDGIIMWDDSQRWVLEVLTGEDIYTLFDGRVSLGNVYFDVIERYSDSGDALPAVIMYSISGANTEISEFTYGEKGFVKKGVYEENGINRMYSSMPEYR